MKDNKLQNAWKNCRISVDRWILECEAESVEHFVIMCSMVPNNPVRERRAGNPEDEIQCRVALGE